MHSQRDLELVLISTASDADNGSKRRFTVFVNAAVQPTYRYQEILVRYNL